MLEQLLEADGDAIEVLSALTAGALLDEISVRHIPPVTVARDIFRVSQENLRHALILLALLAFPGETQARAAMRTGVNPRTVKRVVAAYRQRFTWLDALIDVRGIVK